jgi:hypothetical protein
VISDNNFVKERLTSPLRATSFAHLIIHYLKTVNYIWLKVKNYETHHALSSYSFAPCLLGPNTPVLLGTVLKRVRKIAKGEY